MPETIKKIYDDVKNNYTQGCSKTDQLILSKFMKEGYYQKHIRRIRRIYTEKSNHLTTIIKNKYSELINVVSNTSGLYVILEFNTKKTEQEIVDEIRKIGIKITPFGQYVKGLKTEKKPMVMLYFFNLNINEFDEIMETIADIILKR